MPRRSCSSCVGRQRRAEQPVLEPVAPALGKLDFGAWPGAASAPGPATRVRAWIVVASVRQSTRRQRTRSDDGASGASQRSTRRDGPSPTHRRLARRIRARVRAERTCTSSSWDAAGSAASSPACWRSSGHTVAVVDKRTEAFRRLPTASAGYRIVGFGFDRDTLIEAGIERGRRPRRGDERRQLQHHVGPGRPRDLRGRAGRRPHLRPPPCGDLPAARHPDRRDRVVDDRPGHAAAPPRRAPGRVGRRERPGLPGRARPPGRVGRPQARRARASRDGSRSSRSPASARARVVERDLVGQEGDILHFVVARSTTARRARRAAALERRHDDAEGTTDARSPIAGAGNVGTFIAERAASRTATRSSCSSRSPTVAAKLPAVDGSRCASATPARCRR